MSYISILGAPYQTVKMPVGTKIAKPETMLQKLEFRRDELVKREKALAKQVANTRAELAVKAEIARLEKAIDVHHEALKVLAMGATK